MNMLRLKANGRGTGSTTELRAPLTHVINSTVASLSVQTIFCALLVLSFEVCLRKNSKKWINKHKTSGQCVNYSHRLHYFFCFHCSRLTALKSFILRSTRHWKDPFFSWFLLPLSFPLLSLSPPFLFLFYLYITITCPLSTYEHKHTTYIRGEHKYSVQWESLDCLFVTKVGAAVKPLSGVLLTVDCLTETMTTLVAIHLEMHPAQNKADVFIGMANIRTLRGGLKLMQMRHVRLAIGRGRKLSFTLLPLNIFTQFNH